jgi:hypothetical protein
VNNNALDIVEVPYYKNTHHGDGLPFLLGKQAGRKKIS